MVRLHPAILLASGVSASCSDACNELSSNFSGQYTDSWSNSTISLWDQKQRLVVPTCVVSPQTSVGVAQALRVILDSQCQFAVHSGGHAQMSGSSNSPGGVTIDLSNLLDAIPLENDQVKLGAGFNLSGAYNALSVYNLTSLLGHSGGVGIGGYALAGGISTNSHRHGLLMDEIYQYELVLPNATLVNVTHDSYPDLYYALRGAGLGANFGIVTSFITQSLPAVDQLGGGLTYSDEYRSDVLRELHNLTADPAADDENAYWDARYTYNATTDSFDFAVVQGYVGAARSPEVFAGLNSIPNTSDTLQIAPERQFAEGEAERRPNGLRNLFGTITYRPSAKLDEAIIQVFRSLVPSISNASGVTPNIITQAMYESYFPFMRERGGNCVGLKSEAGPYMLALFTVAWNDASDDARMNAYMQNLIDGAFAASDARNATVEWIYANYAYETQKPYERYGKENHERLRQIQKGVDPDGVFTSTGLFPGGFKLN